MNVKWRKYLPYSKNYCVINAMTEIIVFININFVIPMDRKIYIFL